LPGLYSVSIGIEGNELHHEVQTTSTGSRWLVFEADLKAAEETILTLSTPAMFRPSEVYGNADVRHLGIPVADIIIEPLPGE
jgi:hypothetical protein